MTPIDQAREAIKQSDVDKLKVLIESHPDLPNQRSEDNDRTLLQSIADYPGNRPRGVEMARLVIDAGANVNVGIESGNETPLHWAAGNDDLELTELLLDAGAEIDVYGGVIENGTPLWGAVFFRCVNVANLLIDRGGAVNLMIIAGAGRRDLVDQFFDDEGNVTESAGALPCWDKPKPPKRALNSAFGLACRNGHVTLAKILLERGADPEWVNSGGETALQQAKSGNHKIVVDWLKERGIASSDT